MKNNYLLLLAAMAFLISCESESLISEQPSPVQQIEVDMSDFYLFTEDTDDSEFASRATPVKKCVSMQVLNKKLLEDKDLAKRMYKVEENLRRAIASKKPNTNGNGNGNGNGGGGGGDTTGEEPVGDNLGTIQIPVVVHVLYNTSAQNISDAQINSQIDILNADFSATNADLGLVPAAFSGVTADANFQFTLAQVVRKSTTRTSFGTNDAIKFDANGGSNAVDPSRYLNMWVGNIGGGILGYAQFPGGALATDGVVVAPNYFGSTGTAQAPFDLGRTASHEVGHWLNLRHIWGDGRCNRDDFVSDTPRSDRPNYGCPSFPTVHCRSTDMTMNFMDYTNDACMQMFTQGQKERMRGLFYANGARSSFIL